MPIPMKRKIYSEEINFITLTVVDWVDVFTRRIYNDFIIENLAFCQRNKGLKIYAYVLMTNHLHLIVKSESCELSDVIRDFKTFTSKKIIKIIEQNLRESKRDWMLNIFKKQGRNNPLNKNFQFWQNGNYPVGLFSNSAIQQKIDYIHKNPVRAGFVDQSYKYYYSSANPSNPLQMD